MEHMCQRCARFFLQKARKTRSTRPFSVLSPRRASGPIDLSSAPEPDSDSGKPPRRPAAAKPAPTPGFRPRPAGQVLIRKFLAPERDPPPSRPPQNLAAAPPGGQLLRRTGERPARTQPVGKVQPRTQNEAAILRRNRAAILSGSNTQAVYEEDDEEEDEDVDEDVVPEEFDLNAIDMLNKEFSDVADLLAKDVGLEDGEEEEEELFINDDRLRALLEQANKNIDETTDALGEVYLSLREADDDDSFDRDSERFLMKTLTADSDSEVDALTAEYLGEAKVNEVDAADTAEDAPVSEEEMMDNYIEQVIDPSPIPTEPLPYTPQRPTTADLRLDWPNTPLSSSGLTESVIQKITFLAQRLPHGHWTPAQIAERYEAGSMVRFASAEEKATVLEIAAKLANERAAKAGADAQPGDMQFSSLAERVGEKERLLDAMVRGVYPVPQRKAGVQGALVNDVLRQLGKNETYQSEDARKFVERVERLVGSLRGSSSGREQSANNSR